MAEEIHHHDHEHVSEGSNSAMILAVIVVLLLIGFLLWRFLPGRASSSSVNVNLPSNSTGQSY